MNPCVPFAFSDYIIIIPKEAVRCGGDVGDVEAGAVRRGDFRREYGAGAHGLRGDAAHAAAVHPAVRAGPGEGGGECGGLDTETDRRRSVSHPGKRAVFQRL